MSHFWVYCYLSEQSVSLYLPDSHLKVGICQDSVLGSHSSPFFCLHKISHSLIFTQHPCSDHIWMCISRSHICISLGISTWLSAAGWTLYRSIHRNRIEGVRCFLEIKPFAGKEEKMALRKKSNVFRLPLGHLSRGLWSKSCSSEDPTSLIHLMWAIPGRAWPLISQLLQLQQTLKSLLTDFHHPIACPSVKGNIEGTIPHISQTF